MKYRVLGWNENLVASKHIISIAKSLNAFRPWIINNIQRLRRHAIKNSCHDFYAEDSWGMTNYIPQTTLDVITYPYYTISDSSFNLMYWGTSEDIYGYIQSMPTTRITHRNSAARVRRNACDCSV